LKRRAFASSSSAWAVLLAFGLIVLGWRAQAKARSTPPPK
jgi:hypothetical protein